MEQPYSVLADWLSKFHTWPEFIQMLWLVVPSATVLGVTWLVMRGLRDIAAVWRGRGEATLYGVIEDADKRPLLWGDKELRTMEDSVSLQPPAALSGYFEPVTRRDRNP